MAVNVGEAVGYLDLDTSKFKKGISSALQELQAFRNSASSLGDKITALGSSMTKMGSTLTKSVTVPLIGLGTAAVATTAKFESAMSQVQATMGITKDTMTEVHGETVNAMDALGAIAKKMGAETAFSATECAEALNYMALAGYDVETSIDMLPNVLNLAAAGGMELARASDMVTDSQTALGLSIEQTNTLVDQMAKTASKSNTSVSQLGDAILTVGGIAQTLSGGTTELNTVLGLLADNGIKASEAGTHLRNIILAMNPTTTEAAEAWDQLGVSAYDADGNLRPLQDTFQDLSKAMEGMSDQEKTDLLSKMFNKTDLASINALLGTSAERWTDLSAAISDSAGSASQMAETQLDNLSGQLTILKSSLEGAAISFGELLLPVIKDVISVIQRFTDRINNLSDKQKKIIVTIAEVLAVVGPLLLIIGKVVTLVRTVMHVIKILKPAIATLNAVMSANPIGLIITAIGLLVAAFVYLWNHCEGFRNFFIKMWEGLKNVVKTVVDWIKENWKTMLLFLINPLAGIFKYCYDHFEGFRDFVDNIVQSVKAFFVDLWESIKSTLSSLVDALVVFFTETIPNALQSAIDWVKNFADEIAKFFTETIPETLSQLVEWFKSLPGKIWDALLSAMAKVRQWGTDLKNWAQTKIPEVVTKIINKFKELPKKIVSVGKNLVEGLWNGINDKVDWVLDKIKGFGDRILNGIKDFFGIASPSKKTREMGKYLAEGLSLGIEDNEDMVLDSADSLAGGLLESLKSMLEKLNGVLDFIINPFAALNDQKNAYDAITESIWKQIEALKELKAIRDLIFIGSSLNRADSILAQLNSSGNSQSVQHSQGSSNQNSYVGGNTYNFYSPQAISPVEAAKLMKQTAQQMALDT